MPRFSFLYNSLTRIFTIFSFSSILSIFGLKQPDFREKKVVYPFYTLSGPTAKKNLFFMSSQTDYKHARGQASNMIQEHYADR